MRWQLLSNWLWLLKQTFLLWLSLFQFMFLFTQKDSILNVWLTERKGHVSRLSCIDLESHSPENGQAEWPQHQRATQVQSLPFPHEVLPSKYDRSVQAREYKRLGPAEKHTHSDAYYYLSSLPQNTDNAVTCTNYSIETVTGKKSSPQTQNTRLRIYWIKLCSCCN